MVGWPKPTAARIGVNCFTADKFYIGSLKSSWARVGDEDYGSRLVLCCFFVGSPFFFWHSIWAEPVGLTEGALGVILIRPSAIAVIQCDGLSSSPTVVN